MASDRVETSVQVLEVSGERQERLRYELRRLPWIPVAIIFLMVFAAIFAPLVAPHSPTKQSLRDKLQPPAWQAEGSAKHLLGTDILGRDILSRLIYGARVSLIVAFTALLAGGAIGGVLGLLSGYAGGKTDTFIMRAVDGHPCFPDNPLCLIVSGDHGAGTADRGPCSDPDSLGEVRTGHARRGVWGLKITTSWRWLKSTVAPAPA